MVEEPYLTIAEACKLLEHDPEILKWVEIRIIVRGQRVSIFVRFSNGFDVWSDLDGVDVDVLSFGTFIRNSTTLHKLRLVRLGFGDEVDLNGELPAAAAECFNALFAEVKHNKSIKSATVELTGLLMDDLSYFILNNEALKRLELLSEDLVSLEQSTVLSRAIRIAHLEKLDIGGCSFENDGAFERMMGGCASVNKLRVGCRSNSECTAVVALLWDPTNVLRELALKWICKRSEDGDSSSLDVQRATRDILESLVENTNLKRLELYGLDRTDHFDSDNLLCDASTIESIINSNHTLETLDIGRYLSFTTYQCLRLNKIDDKDKVIRDKIRQLYFVGEFDVSPFSDMAASVLPEVVSHIEGKDKLSAIYRLLQGRLPDLCNPSDRAQIF